MPFGAKASCVFYFAQFGQLGVGDNVDHCSPVQVRFPDEEV